MSPQPQHIPQVLAGLDPGAPDFTMQFYTQDPDLTVTAMSLEMDEVSGARGYARAHIPVGQMQRQAPCPDCGVVLQPHRDDCLTLAVDEGRMTPRERQIARLDRREDLNLSRIIDETIARTTEPPSLITVSPGDLSKLLTPVSDDVSFAVAGETLYKGVPIAVDAHLEDGVLHVIPARGGILSGAALQAGQSGRPDPGPAVDRAEYMRRLYNEFGIGRASASGVIKNIT